MTDFPITPPPELVQQWAIMFEHFSDDEVFTQVARWGANQELEKCCEWLVRNYNYPEAGNPLRTARRPKPPSLKEQALSELNLTADSDGAELSRTQVDLIRCALEQLSE